MVKKPQLTLDLVGEEYPPLSLCRVEWERGFVWGGKGGTHSMRTENLEQARWVQAVCFVLRASCTVTRMLFPRWDFCFVMRTCLGLFLTVSYDRGWGGPRLGTALPTKLCSP